MAGTRIGQRLVAIFQQRGKNNLDGGIIQQVYHQKELLSLAGLSDKEQTSNEVMSSENLTSSNLESATEATQSQDKIADDETTLTSKEAEVYTEESTTEVHPN